ncbi:MAG: GtrA family protein [Patescibacteria group bacterium]
MSHIRQLYDRLRLYFSTKFPRIFKIIEPQKSIIKFFIAGSFSGGADIVLLFVFHGLFRLDIVLSTSLAFICAFLISFTLQKFWTFRNYCQKKVLHQLFLYIINALIGLYLNGWFMHLLVNKYQTWYILAQIIVNLVLAVVNFLVYKFIIFKIGENETDRQ